MVDVRKADSGGVCDWHPGTQEHRSRIDIGLPVDHGVQAGLAWIGREIVTPNVGGLDPLYAEGSILPWTSERSHAGTFCCASAIPRRCRTRRVLRHIHSAMMNASLIGRESSVFSRLAIRCFAGYSTFACAAGSR